MTETFIDSKKEVDNQLKKTCEDFIALVTNMLIGPLKMFLDKVRYEKDFFPTRINLLLHICAQSCLRISSIRVNRKEIKKKLHGCHRNIHYGLDLL